MSNKGLHYIVIIQSRNKTKKKFPSFLLRVHCASIVIHSEPGTSENSIKKQKTNKIP